jgi:hypothetical protein
MINKQTIETQLDCRATASLNSQIAEDLSHPDKPLLSLLEDTKEQDESEDSKNTDD